MERRNSLTDYVNFFLVVRYLVTIASGVEGWLRGQSSAFPIEFASRPYNSHTTVRACDVSPSYAIAIDLAHHKVTHSGGVQHEHVEQIEE